MANLKSGRRECPACGRKGLGYDMHPHALGWKDYNTARCRYCLKRFRVSRPSGNKPATESKEVSGTP